MSKKKYADNNPKTLIWSRKVNLFTVPPVSIIQEATAMQNGASKYGPYNWRGMGSTVAASIYLSAALRHLLSYLDGEDYASDSKVHHLAHAKACMGIILDATSTGNLIDDRPSPGYASELIDSLIEHPVTSRRRRKKASS